VFFDSQIREMLWEETLLFIFSAFRSVFARSCAFDQGKKVKAKWKALGKRNFLFFLLFLFA